MPAHCRSTHTSRLQQPGLHAANPLQPPHQATHPPLQASAHSHSRAPMHMQPTPPPLQAICYPLQAVLGSTYSWLLWNHQHISVLPPMHPLLRAAAVLKPMQQGLQAAHSLRAVFEVPMHGPLVCPLSTITGSRGGASSQGQGTWSWPQQLVRALNDSNRAAALAGSHIPCSSSYWTGVLCVLQWRQRQEESLLQA